MSPSQLRWYARRLRGMTPTEIVWRMEDLGRQEVWRRSQVHPGVTTTPVPARRTRRFTTPIHKSKVVAPPDAARQALINVAQDLLAGHWEVLGVQRNDMADPDWFWDPVSGRRFPMTDMPFASTIGTLPTTPM